MIADDENRPDHQHSDRFATRVTQHVLYPLRSLVLSLVPHCRWCLRRRAGEFQLAMR